MPTVNLRYCSQSGCPARVNKAGMCPTHKRDRYRAQDRQRKGADHRSVYSTKAWKALRALVLSEFPICQMCQREWSREVDHIKPVSAGGAPFDRVNVQALCRTCHSSKTMSELNDGRGLA